jgi:RNA polymerase sigma-70 factor (ECF subfamily)
MDRPSDVKSNVAAFRVSDTTPTTTDRELIDQTVAGDGAAFAILVERFQRKIYRVAYAIVRDEFEADVVTQDTFVQAFTNLARFEGRAELETWLTRIAINRSRDTLRRRRFVSLFVVREGDEEGATILEPVDDRPDPERQLMSSQLRASIQRAEKQLSAQQKVIFRLRHYENLSLEDIAHHLGLRAGTVRAHLFRAIHKIRRELAEWRTTRGSEEREREAALQ